MEQKVIVDVVIPVYRPERSFQALIRQLMRQTVPPHHIYLLQTVDQEGGTTIHPEDERISVHPVLKREFDHGGTRHFGAGLAMEQWRGEDRSTRQEKGEQYLLFMTQDAMPKDSRVIEHLLQPFRDARTAIAYARQFPRENADIVERLTRLHNYPEEDRFQTQDDLEELGIRTWFCSDVCAMYRCDIYQEMGGFVHPTIFNEDMIMASKVISAGYQVAYCAGARVIHSHSYTCMQQFHRNFDLGVSQRQYREIFDAVSSEKEGAGYAGTLLKYLLRRGKLWKAFYFALQCGFKLFGYKLGKRYDRLPRRFVLACTMNPRYFEKMEA